jgi:integrase
MFSVYTGARRGEVLALRWKDIDVDAGAVTIRRSLTDVQQQREFKKRKNDRSLTITLSKSILTVLREHREAQNRERSALGTAYKEQDLVRSCGRRKSDPWEIWGSRLTPRETCRNHLGNAS